MLGRTDSRRRMLLLLITFVVIAASLVARLAYWQVTQRDRLAQEAFAQTTARTETPSRRGDIYDRSGVVVLATTVDRERLAAMPSFIGSQRRQQVAAELVRILAPRGRRRRPADRADDGRQEVHRPRPRSRPGDGRPDPGRGDERHDRGDHARAAARPRLPPRGRRTRLDAGRAAPRLRQPRRRGPVRRRAVLPGPAGRPAPDRPRPA